MLQLLLGVLMSRRAQTVTLLLLTVLCVAAGTAAPLYAAAADRAVIQAELRSATPSERAVTFTADVSAVNGYDASLRALRSEVRSVIAPGKLTEVTGVRVSGTAGSAAEGETAASVVMRDDACAHLALLEGTCPTAAGEAIVSEPTAQHFGIGAGGELAFRAAESNSQTALRVAGVYDPGPPQRDGDPYWAGRSDIVPQGRRATSPIFVSAATIDTLGAEKVVAMVDLYAGESSLSADNIDDVGDEFASELAMPDLTVVNGLPPLLRRIEATRHVLRLAAPVGAVQLLVVCWFVLMMVVASTAAARRGELAIGALRGAPARHRVLLALGPTALMLVLAAPIGLLVGWLTVRVLTMGTPAGPLPVPIGRTALLTAVGTLLVVVASAAIAEWRAMKGSIIDGLRQVPRRRRPGFGLIEWAVIVVAVAAVVQSAVSARPDGGLALMAPLLVALVAGLLTARLVPAAANAFGVDRLHRGRLTSGHAAIQLARRPGADRLVALTVVAVALVGQTVAAWDVSESAAWQRAELELGAARVLTVEATSPSMLLAAVHRADPDGAWAMAATRGMASDRTLIGVESARLAAVSTWPDQATVSPRQAVRALQPKVAEPVVLNGSVLELGVTVEHDLDSPMRVTAALTAPSGELITGAVDIARKSSNAHYSIALPVCATPPGCRLGWLSFPRSAQDVHLNALVQQSPRRTLLAGRSISAASRWRPALGSERDVTVVSISGPDPGVSLTYTPSDPHNISNDIRMFVNDGPVPLPLVAAGPQRLADTRELTEVDPWRTRPSPSDVLLVSSLLPGAAADGLLFDLDDAIRVGDGDDGGGDVALQVWLNDAAPAGALDRLRAVGLVPVQDETVASRVARYQQQGAGLAVRLHLAAAALGVLLVGLAVLVLAASDRKARAADLAALRVQGWPRAAAARSAQLGGLMVIAIAAPVGTLTAAASWRFMRPARGEPSWGQGSVPLPGPHLGIVAGALIAGTAVLLMATYLAGRSLAGAGAGSRESGAEVRP